jgi:hypothetical protein
MSKLNMDLIAKRKITPREWLERVMNVLTSARCEVAYIIWWDWFSGRLTTERWNNLDLFLKNPTWSNATDRQIIKGLMQCGYSETHAINRVGNKGNTVKANKA